MKTTFFAALPCAALTHVPPRGTLWTFTLLDQWRVQNI
jgi:hypothetical protein